MNYQFSARNLAKDLSASVIAGLRPESANLLRLHEDCLQELMTAKTQMQRPHPRDFLVSYLRKLNISIDPQFLLNIQQHDEFEIWSPDFRFIGCSGAFLRISSYKISQLLEMDWNDLFDRPPESLGAVLSAVERISNGERTIHGVTGWHTVRERHALKVEVEVDIKALTCGAAGDTNKPAAIIALISFRDRIPWGFGLV